MYLYWAVNKRFCQRGHILHGSYEPCKDHVQRMPVAKLRNTVQKGEIYHNIAKADSEIRAYGEY